MSRAAFITVAADHVEPGPVRWVNGVAQQETRLFMGGQCICTLLVTYLPDSPEWVKAQGLRALDGCGQVLA